MGGTLIDQEFVGAVYDAALYAGDWRPALARLRDLLSGIESCFSISEPELPPTTTSSGAAIGQAQIDSYLVHYRWLDPKNAVFARRPAGFIFNDVEHFDDAFVAKDAFYQEFSAAIGTRHTLDLLLERGDGRDVYLASMRSRAAGPHARTEEALLRAAGAHFARALAMRARVEEAQRAALAAGSALDCLAFGVAVIDEKGRLALANKAAREAMGPQGPLRIQGARLSACEGDLQAFLGQVRQS
ncbi:MAG: hypothetical protein ACREEH_08115, partial [Caulobacteraceae bacterium]